MTVISDPHFSAADPGALLTSAFRLAIIKVLGDQHAEIEPTVRPAQQTKLGDYQANFVMGLAKKTGRNPRELAQQIIEAADISVIAEPPELAGPGFINIRLKPDAIARLLAKMDNERLGVVCEQSTHPIVIDLCGVNVAKQTHVGHLRSTIIGDCLARVLGRTGRRVCCENHLGDWGLPIAMVLHELRESGVDLDALELDDLDKAYRSAQLSVRTDVQGIERALQTQAGPHRILELTEQNAGADEALAAAKATLVRLQRREAELVSDWEKLIEVTMRAVYESFDLMDVKLGPDNNRGESFYRDKLEPVIEEFIGKGIAQEDCGALVVRFDDRSRPLLIRKSDGGYLYATTDLAALRYRIRGLGASRVIYVVDARQRDHFRDVFDAVRLIGWDVLPDGTHAELIHIPFGAVLGPNNKPLKTRDGANVTLRWLLTKAIQHGTAEVMKRAADAGAPTHGLPEPELQAIGKAVGIAAVKYADLSNDLVRDYVFNFDRMIAFEGATGPYLQYAHARICSIFTKANENREQLATNQILINEPAEKQLALLLLRFPAIVSDVARTLEPHRLCSYLFELANGFNGFYQQCPVIRTEDAAVRGSRLRLCDLTQRVLADGLDLLGIAAPQKM